ncbi:hypothetical protein ACOZB2_27940 [Pantoea endophytica]
MLLSPHPKETDWAPVPRSNAHIKVSIVNQEASRLALTFQHLMASAGNEESPEYKVLLQAFLYVLRLSNMPAGYTDLTMASADSTGQGYCHTLNAWTPIKLALLDALASGMLSLLRASIEQAVKRADKLIEDWNDATPMAARLLAEKKYLTAGCPRLAVVLPYRHYIFLANRLLERQYGDEWPATEFKLKCHTLSTLSNHSLIKVRADLGFLSE